MFSKRRFTMSRLPLSALATSTLVSSAQARAETPGGTYWGLLAFDFKGKAVREWLVVSFHQDGTPIFGAEEGHDEPVDSKTGLATRTDFEAASLGVWRGVGANGIEFGAQQYRAGSAFFGPVNKHGEGLLPTCSFVLTGQLETNADVSGEKCDLGGVNGGCSIQSDDGTVTESNPLGLGIGMDYCPQRLSIERFLELAPLN